MPDQAELERVRQLVKQQQHEDKLGIQALAEPLPGPTRVALAIDRDIVVRQYRVRPFYDIDYEFLTALKHPLYDAMKLAMSGQDPKLDDVPRGPMAWQLVWLLTHTPDEVEVLAKNSGWDGVRNAAKAEFGKLQLFELVELATAAIRQMSIYWSPAIGYETAKIKVDGEDGKEEANAASPFTESSAAPLTGSDGSLTSAVG